MRRSPATWMSKKGSEFALVVIVIIDRPRLQAHACNCYDVVRVATDATKTAR